MNWQKNISPSQYFSGGYDNIQEVVDENGKSGKAFTNVVNCRLLNKPIAQKFPWYSTLQKIYIRSNPECKHLTVALVAQQLKICTCGLWTHSVKTVKYCLREWKAIGNNTVHDSLGSVENWFVLATRILVGDQSAV